MKSAALVITTIAVLSVYAPTIPDQREYDLLESLDHKVLCRYEHNPIFIIFGAIIYSLIVYLQEVSPRLLPTLRQMVLAIVRQAG